MVLYVKLVSVHAQKPSCKGVLLRIDALGCLIFMESVSFA